MNTGHHDPSDTVNERNLVEVLSAIFDTTGPIFSRADWARLLDVTPAALSQWVNGRTTPSAEHLLRLVTLLRTRDIVNPRVIAVLEAAVESSHLSGRSGCSPLTLQVIDGLENYASCLHHAQAQLLKSALMSVVDSVGDRSAAVDTLLAYVRNPTASNSPYNWHFATVIGSLTTRGAAEFGAALVDVASAARKTRAELGQGSGWVWMPIPAFAFRMAPDRYSRQGVAHGLTLAMKGAASELATYASEEKSLERVDAVLNATTLLAYEMGYRDTLKECLSALADAVDGMTPSATGVLFAEFFRRGRRRWLPEVAFRAAFARLESVVTKGASRLELDEPDANVQFLSEKLARIERLPRRIRDELRGAWGFLRAGGRSLKDLTEDEATISGRQRILGGLLDGVRSTTEPTHQYLYALTVYDLLTGPHSLDPVPSDAAKTDPVVYEFWRRLQLDIVEDFVSQKISRIAGILLFDVGYQLMPDRMMVELSEAIRMAGDELVCSVICLPGPWEMPVHRQRLRNAVLCGERSRGPAVIWVLDALDALASERTI